MKAVSLAGGVTIVPVDSAAWNSEKVEFKICVLQNFRLDYSFPAWKSVFLSISLLDMELLTELYSSD